MGHFLLLSFVRRFIDTRRLLLLAIKLAMDTFQYTRQTEVSKSIVSEGLEKEREDVENFL